MISHAWAELIESPKTAHAAKSARIAQRRNTLSRNIKSLPCQKASRRAHDAA
jgi:hypothetical protein